MRLQSVGVGLAVVALGAGSGFAAPVSFALDPARSHVVVHVGRAGLFSFAGHEHEVEAPLRSGHVVADAANLAASSVEADFEVGTFRVSGRGEPAGDVADVQTRMLSADVLDPAAHPQVTFRSRAVRGTPGSPGHWRIEVTGDLEIHGVTRSLVVPLEVTIAGSLLTATGNVAFEQSDFGIRPVSVAGVVKVKDELRLDLQLVATAAGAEEPVKP
jgi:polyisoprenoid-binding protein YceI